MEIDLINNWKCKIIRWKMIDDDVEIIVIYLIVMIKKNNNCLIVDVDFVLCLIMNLIDVFDNVKINNIWFGVVNNW